MYVDYIRTKSGDWRSNRFKVRKDDPWCLQPLAVRLVSAWVYRATIVGYRYTIDAVKLIQYLSIRNDSENPLSMHTDCKNSSTCHVLRSAHCPSVKPDWFTRTYWIFPCDVALLVGRDYSANRQTLGTVRWLCFKTIITGYNHVSEGNKAAAVYNVSTLFTQ